MLVIPINTTIAPKRYILNVVGAVFQFLCSQIAATIFPISSAAPIAITASIDPGNIVARPMILKYAAIIEILSADNNVKIENNILDCRFRVFVKV